MLDLYFNFFLEISNSIRGIVSLKDNILLNTILPDFARGTQDLFLCIINKELYTEIKPMLHDKGKELTLNGGSYLVKEDIEENTSGGIVVYDENNERVFSIDISMDKNLQNFIHQYTFRGATFNGSSIDKIVADKCLSTLSKKRFRRVKDFFDLYIIGVNRYNSSLSIDYKRVRDIMIEKVGIDEFNELLNNYPFSETILIELNKAGNKLTISLNIRNIEAYKEPFNVVYGKISLIYDGVRGVGDERFR